LTPLTPLTLLTLEAAPGWAALSAEGADPVLGVCAWDGFKPMLIKVAIIKPKTQGPKPRLINCRCGVREANPSSHWAHPQHCSARERKKEKGIDIAKEREFFMVECSFYSFSTLLRLTTSPQ
jgi:hypothetical protein